MTKVLFVHGTGVRRKAFEHVFALFTSGMHRIRPGYGVDPCLWGEEEGTSLLASGVSIPDSMYKSRWASAPSGLPERRLAEPTRLATAIWTILEVDPVAELRELIASSGRISSSTTSDAAATAKTFRDAVSVDLNVSAALQDAGLNEVAVPAMDILLDDPVCRQVIANDRIEVAELIGPMSRAFVAICLSELDGQLGSEAPIDGSHRDAVVSAVIDSVGGDSRGLGSKVLGVAATKLLEWGVLSSLEKRRVALIPKVAPAMGDVLKYLARGDGIRAYLRASIANADEEIVIVAHSLGGIAAVDLLVQESFEQVQGLITVGTQVGLLYELNALPSLEFGRQLPKSFPQWDNLLDPRDLLAYSSQALFPSSSRDHIIDNEAPFPRNHSAYFGNPSFYSVLGKVLP